MGTYGLFILVTIALGGVATAILYLAQSDRRALILIAAPALAVVEGAPHD